MQPCSLRNFRQQAVYVLDPAPTIYPSLNVGNDVIPRALIIQGLLQDEVRVEVATRLDLAKDDVFLSHLLVAGDGGVGGLVVRTKPRI